MNPNNNSITIQDQYGVIGTVNTSGQVLATIVHDLTDKEGKAAFALHEKFDRAMAKAKPTKREEALKSFRNLYPRLEMYLAEGKPMKEVLAAFNEVTNGKVCARTFKELLKQQRANQASSGSHIASCTCGQPHSATETQRAPIAVEAEETGDE